MTVFELPETTVLARQLAAEIAGRKVDSCIPGNSPHKFVWYGLSPEEYVERATGKTAGPAFARARFISLPLEPGYVQVFGEMGGRLLLHRPGSPRPTKYHLLLEFDDGRALSAMTQMWGFIGIMTPAEIAAHKYAGNLRVAPLDPEFTDEYFQQLVREYPNAHAQSVKALLTQDGTVPGIGNSYLQDILFRARIHPRRKVAALTEADVVSLYEEITGVLAEAIAEGGRSDEVDLYGRPGGYARLMDRNAVGKGCPVCGATVEKMQFLGGACYFCPACQT